MFFSFCFNIVNFFFCFFKLCYVYCISVICTSCYRCNLTCYIISYIANGYSRCCRFPCGTSISRCRFGTNIITSCTGCYSCLRFTAKSYATFSSYLCVVADSYCIVHSCCSTSIARANCNSIVSTCYSTFIAYDNCVSCIRHSIFRTNSCHVLNFGSRITYTHSKVVFAFTTLNTCHSIVNTDHRCAQCVISLVSATEGHRGATTVRVFNCSTQCFREFLSRTTCISCINRNRCNGVCNFITCTHHDGTVGVKRSIRCTYNTVTNTRVEAASRFRFITIESTVHSGC